MAGGWLVSIVSHFFNCWVYDMPLKIHTEAIEGLDPNLQVKGVSHFAICQWLSLRLWTPTARMHHCSYYSAFIYFIIIQSNHSLSSSVCIFTSPKDVFKWKFCTVINLSGQRQQRRQQHNPRRLRVATAVRRAECGASSPGRGWNIFIRFCEQTM